MTSFLLIHGAGHGGWCWRYVAERLTAKGHRVLAPSLTGLGDRVHLLSRNVDLETHIADTLGVIEAEELDDLVLVGHSYGGMVVGGAADRVAAKIRSLVFLDAHVPEDGKSCFDLMAPERAAGMRRLAEQSGDGWLLPMPSAAGFGVTEPRDQAWVDRRVRPHPIATMAQQARLTGGWHGIRRKTYILCEAPYASPGSSSPNPFPAYAARLKQESGWTVRSLPCGHDAMIAMPDELTAMLLAAAI